MKELFCQQCPNGCHLLLDWVDDATVEITGNKCQQGIVYAARQLRSTRSMRMVAKEATPHFGKLTLKDIVLRWSQELTSVHYHIPIVGSPERTLFRVVVETHEGLFLLEQVASLDVEKKKRIAFVLDSLHDLGLKRVQTYCKDAQGRFIVEHLGGFWQLSRFLPGIVLDRQTYLYEQWRGEDLANFLIELDSLSKNMSSLILQDIFSLKQYILRLFSQIEMHHPKLATDIMPIKKFLEKEWMILYDRFPVSFCHGDYHPMNMIWGDHHMRCVIDWEFCGYKPEIYDVANLIGCLGIEHPSSLVGEFAGSFIHHMRLAHIFQELSWTYAVEFMVAVRFAWLSEWLRRKDQDMIEMEIDYMNLLVAKQKELIHAWGLDRTIKDDNHFLSQGRSLL